MSTQTRSLVRPAWDGNPPQADAARQRLHEATARCIARDGMAGTTMAAVAAEAGVSRQTVYRYFSGRDQLVLRTVRVAAEGVRAKIEHATHTLSDPADMIVEAVVLGLEELRSNPVLRAIWDTSTLDGSVFTRFTGPAGIGWTRGPLAAAIEAAGWNEADADAALELMMRMFLSLVISPAPQRSPDEIRAFLYRHLVPGLGLAASDEV